MLLHDNLWFLRLKPCPVQKKLVLNEIKKCKYVLFCLNGMTKNKFVAFYRFDKKMNYF